MSRLKLLLGAVSSGSSKPTCQTFLGADGVPLTFQAVDATGTGVTLATYTAAHLYATYDGTYYFSAAAVTIEAGTTGNLTITPTAAQLAVAGKYDAQIKLTNAGGDVEFLEPFVLDVQPTALPAVAIPEEIPFAWASLVIQYLNQRDASWSNATWKFVVTLNVATSVPLADIQGAVIWFRTYGNSAGSEALMQWVSARQFTASLEPVFGAGGTQAFSLRHIVHPNDYERASYDLGAIYHFDNTQAEYVEVTFTPDDLTGTITATGAPAIPDIDLDYTPESP